MFNNSDVHSIKFLSVKLRDSFDSSIWYYDIYVYSCCYLPVHFFRRGIATRGEPIAQYLP